MRRTTVLIADDHAIVREGVVALLKAHDFEVIGAVDDGEQLVEAAGRLRPDIIVADLSMPGMSGLHALVRLKAESVVSKVIVLTMHDDATLAARAMRAGAAGFLVKTSAGEELVTAIHQVLQGRIYLAPAVTKPVLEQLAASPSESEPRLSARQLDVLRLILEGRRMKEIAEALQLSTRTVETHKYQIMAILGVSSTAELVRYALEHRLILE